MTEDFDTPDLRSAHVIVLGNEKGGTGKSTTAVHTAVALTASGRRVAAIDLDTRQRTLGRYLDNRGETVKRLGVDLPMPAYTTFDPAKGEPIEAALDRMAEEADVVVVDTPGRDDPDARKAMLRADTLVTRDKALLRLARKALERHGVRICRPEVWSAELGQSTSG